MWSTKVSNFVLLEPYGPLFYIQQHNKRATSMDMDNLIILSNALKL